MSELVLTDENFDNEVVKSPIPVVVDLWAPWCGPCLMVAPVLEEIAKELNGKIKVGKLNVDENQKIATQFGISAIPTLLIFKNGQEIKKIVGFSGKPKLVQEINSIL